MDWTDKLSIALSLVKDGYPIRTVAGMMNVDRHLLSDHLKKYEEYISYKESLYIMPEAMKAVVDGAMVGDGHISRQIGVNGNCSLILGLGLAQTGHAEEFSERLKAFGYKKDPPFRLYEKQVRVVWTHPMFNAQRKRWYPDGIKRVPSDISNDPEMWRWAYAGDGSLSPCGEWTRVAHFAVADFTIENVRFLRELLFKHDIESTVQTVQKFRISDGLEEYRLYVTADSTERFLKMTSPPVRSLEYKWDWPERPTRNCKYCDTEFIPNQRNTVYCTYRCGVRDNHPFYTKDERIKALYRDYRNTRIRWLRRNPEPEEKFVTFSQWCMIKDPESIKIPLATNSS